LFVLHFCSPDGRVAPMPFPCSFFGAMSGSAAAILHRSTPYLQRRLFGASPEPRVAWRSVGRALRKLARWVTAAHRTQRPTTVGSSYQKQLLVSRFETLSVYYSISPL
jgi:hypothetical protein